MSTQDNAFTSLCRNGCGFFGRIENKGLCSVCFKESMKARTEEKNVSEATPSVVKVEPVPLASSPAASTAQMEERKEEEEKDVKKKSRCFSCRKRLGLTGFSCRCGGLYCAVHRYTDKHQCSFDYKALGEREISEANPVIVAAKLNKI